MLVFSTPLVNQRPSNVLTGSPNPLPCVNKYKGMYLYSVWGGGDRVVWRAQTGVIHCVFDQIPSLQNCFTTPKKTQERRGPQTDKHLLPSTFTGQFLRKADILGLVSLQIFASWLKSPGTWRQVFICLRPPPLLGFFWGGKAILQVRNLIKYTVFYS